MLNALQVLQVVWGQIHVELCYFLLVFSNCQPSFCSLSKAGLHGLQLFGTHTFSNTPMLIWLSRDHSWDTAFLQLLMIRLRLFSFQPLLLMSLQNHEVCFCNLCLLAFWKHLKEITISCFLLFLYVLFAFIWIFNIYF